MTHTALTANEEIRRIRGLAAAGMESRMGGGGYHDPSAHRGPAEDPTYRDVLTFVRTRPMRMVRAQAPLSMLVRRWCHRNDLADQFQYRSGTSSGLADGGDWRPVVIEQNCLLDIDRASLEPVVRR